jgi:hypothetical protein
VRHGEKGYFIEPTRTFPCISALTVSHVVSLVFAGLKEDSRLLKEEVRILLYS